MQDIVHACGISQRPDPAQLELLFVDEISLAFLRLSPLVPVDQLFECVHVLLLNLSFSPVLRPDFIDLRAHAPFDKLLVLRSVPILNRCCVLRQKVFLDFRFLTSITHF